MEQDNSSGFKFSSSANDLSVEHFLTAREDNNDSSSGLNAAFVEIKTEPSESKVQNRAKFPRLISSLALVDSDNEESFDEINDYDGRAKFVVGDSDEPTRTANQSAAIGSTGEAVTLPSGAHRSRLMRQKHSLLHRSYALRTGSDSDDEHCDSNNKGVSCNGDKLARASTSDSCIVGRTVDENNYAAGTTNQSNNRDVDDDGRELVSETRRAPTPAAVSERPFEPQQLADSCQPVLIRIDDTSESSNYCWPEQAAVIDDREQPPPPPSSPVIGGDTTIGYSDARRKSSNHHLRANLSPIDATKTATGANNLTGSLSDNSHRRSSDKMALLERRQMEERLRNWKRSNKIISHIRDNPFDLHMECLQRIEKLNLEGKLRLDKDDDVCQEENNTLKADSPPVISTKSTEGDPNNSKQQEQLQSYATHLSHLYRKNQTLMDNNSDFRNLLYNIICCLMTQDEQVLASASVTKMIDVIRTHLESASRYYSSAIMQLSTSNNVAATGEISRDHRKSSLASITSCSTSSNTSSSNNQQPHLTPQDKINLHPDGAFLTTDRTTSFSERPHRPADFRRISSVSYNDEQLINDLCNNHDVPSEQTGSSSASESPWKYEELSHECKHQPKRVGRRYNSQSSFENQAANLVEYFMHHDSGLGTATCHDDDEDDTRKGKARVDKRLFRQQHSHQETTGDASRRSSWANSRRQLSYLSSDDCFTHLHTNDDYSTTRQEDEDLFGQHSDQQGPVDVASLKSELEWTLNKLINFELKYSWLTGRDTLRRAIRRIGVPNEIRGKVWLILIDQMIGPKYDAANLLAEAATTITGDEEQQHDSLTLHSLSGQQQQHQVDGTHATLKQIDLDVNRTMPGHKLFDDGAEGGIKLRKVLVAYSIHVNREIGYCQGFNFIVALLLSVFEGHEEHALRGFICIVDHIFPSKFYFDHYLTGARADQFLLADFICDQLIKNPSTAERKMVEGVTSSITLNWFISLFHGAVPTLTRLTILDHFMLEGVKALFRFTMAILYLAFQVTPPSSCEVFHTIRTTARDMYDIKLLLSIVEQIKLPKDSYFAIRRSFYMLQSSFNSDQFYMQSLSSEASKQCVANKPLSLQQVTGTRPPGLSLISGSSLVSAMGDTSHFRQQLSNNGSSAASGGPRVCTSSDRSKVCMQNIGKLGRSHLKIMDANDRSNERSLMSPLRNCLVIGVSNCGKSIIVARQSSRKNFKIFREQDLTFHIHELSTEIFDGFYLEDLHMALILTNAGEIYKIDTSKCFADNQTGSAETLMLRSSGPLTGSSSTLGPGGLESERLKLRLASLDPLTKLLWIYAECESAPTVPSSPRSAGNQQLQDRKSPGEDVGAKQLGNPVAARRKALKSNNPFMFDTQDTHPAFGPDQQQQQQRANQQRKILIIDVMTFDMFSAFTVHGGFGDIIKLRTSLVAFCQLANPMSNQFSSRIVRIGPTGRYEHLLSFSDVVDFMINLSESHKHQNQQQQRLSSGSHSAALARNGQRYSSIRRLFNRSVSLHCNDTSASSASLGAPSAGTLTRYYRSLIKSHSNAGEQSIGDHDKTLSADVASNDARKEPAEDAKCRLTSKAFMDHSSCRSILSSCVDQLENTLVSDYLPVNMTFIFRNGKIALFEFTKSYAIHTRESQLDRYDYSRVIDVAKSNDDFIVTILTVLGKLIKVVI